VIIFPLLALLAVLVPCRPRLQDPGRREPRPNEDLRRFDNDTLARAWGYDNTLAGSIPKEPRPASPAPIRPDEYLVVEAGASDQQAWEAFVIRYVLDRNSPVPGEGSPAPLGEAKWHRVKMPTQGELKAEIRFAYATLHSDRREVRMARLPGASVLFVNGEGVIGDPERRGFLGVPVELRAGDNQVFVAGIKGGFELEFWKPETRVVMNTFGLGYPHLGYPNLMDLGAGLVLPIFNASTEPVVDLHCHYGHACCDDGRLVPRVTDWQDGGRLAPLGMCLKHLPLFDFDERVREDCEVLLVPLCVQDAPDTDADRRVACLHIGDEGMRPTTHPRWDDARLASGSRFVYGTRGTEEDRATSLALARYCQQRLWYWTNLCPTLVSDEQFQTPTEMEVLNWGANAFLFGDARTNAITASLSFPSEEPSSEEPTLLRVRAPLREEPAKARAALGVFSGHDARTMRLLYAVDPFFSLRPGVKEAAFAVGETPTGAVVRRR
jgi:hypothetical protein